MKSIKIGGKEICLVEVPDDSHSFEIYDNNVVGGKCVMMLRGKPDYACIYSENLPAGSWILLGRGSEITEEQAKGIVAHKQGLPFINMDENIGTEYYANYMIHDEYYIMSTALESFYSILTSEGYKKETTIVLIKE